MFNEFLADMAKENKTKRVSIKAQPRKKADDQVTPIAGSISHLSGKILSS